MGLSRLQFNGMHHGFLNIDSIKVVEVGLVTSFPKGSGEFVATHVDRRTSMKPKLVPFRPRHSVASGAGDAVDQEHQVQRPARDQIGKTTPLMGFIRQSPLTACPQRRQIPV